MITLRQIEAFKAVMDAGAVNKAAEMMHLSQPAVSRLLSDLEANVGYSLFERRKGKLTARLEARELYAEVERSFAGLGRIVETAERIGNGRNASLRIAVLPFFTVSPLPGIVARLVDENPGLFVSLESRSAHQIVEGIGDGSYDIGLASVPIETPGIGVAPLLRSNVVCLVPADHPLSRREVITPEDLEGVGVILGTERAPMRLEIGRLLSESGVRYERRIEVNTLQMACALISQGAGITFFAHWFVADKPLPGLRTIPFRPELFIELAVLFPVNRPPEGVAADFVLACRETARRT
jgi:DNA-binding transcriptional LysR family regulator